jgi:hypothetical protein
MFVELSRAFQNMGDNQQAATLGLSALKLFENIKDTFVSYALHAATLSMQNSFNQYLSDSYTGYTKIMSRKIGATAVSNI